ncbi:MAG: hypothetical protein ACOZAN_01580 [Patescibacteria group bacterium]
MKRAKLAYLWSLLICLVYLAAILLLGDWISAIWFAFGCTIAWVLLLVDELFLVKLYREQANDSFLISRSVLFLFALFVASVFLLTTVRSWQGSGMLIGIWSLLVCEMWLWRSQPEWFATRFLSQLQRRASRREINYLTILMTIWLGVICLVSWLVMR